MTTCVVLHIHVASADHGRGFAGPHPRTRRGWHEPSGKGPRLGTAGHDPFPHLRVGPEAPPTPTPKKRRHHERRRSPTLSIVSAPSSVPAPATPKGTRHDQSSRAAHRADPSHPGELQA